MSTPMKGFPSNNKTSVSRDMHYANVEPLLTQKDGLSVKSYQYARSVGTDAVEANSTADTIVATAHAALVGDIINFTSGALSGLEYVVASVAANSIVLSESAPAAPAAADTFQILRHKTPVVDASGNVAFSPGPVQFVRNGATQQVIEDTVTPANNRPLPVKLTGVAGDVSINAANLNLDVQLSDQGANADVVRIGDGTDQLAISGAGEASVISASQKAEDSAHASGDQGQFVLAVRNDAASSLVSADGDYAPLQVNATGELKVAASITEQAVFAEDSAHVSGNSGKFVLAVRNDAASSLVSADGDYAPLQVNATGELKVAASITEQAVFAEDSAHVSGDNGKFVLAVRHDAASSLVGADGDYAPLQVNATGELKVAASITEQAVFAEDSAHASGDNGKFVLAVRNDAGTNLVGADGDYAPLQVNSTGALRVTESGVFAEDAAHSSGDLGKFVLAVRNDAGTSLVGADGDYAPLQVNSTGAVRVTEQSIYAEDSAHNSGDNLTAIAAVRNDAGTALAGATGDYIPLTTDANGHAWVKPSSSVGRSKVNLIRNDYSSTNVTTAAYVQLTAATAAAINHLDVFDSSGQTLVFAVGGAGAEVDQFYIFPGGNGKVELSIPSGSRLSVKAVTATASTGELTINTFS